MEPAPPLEIGWLCTPRTCFSKPGRLPPFFTLNQLLPWGVALIMGFQHALAMLGGIVSVPLIVGGCLVRFAASLSPFLAHPCCDRHCLSSFLCVPGAEPFLRRLSA